MATYLISDTHFNHANVIKYCNRPFKDVDDMNTSMVRNWNRVVGSNDAVYFMGDFVMGSKDIGKFIKRLNGRITFIHGNHDSHLHNCKSHVFIEHNGEAFLLIHSSDPECHKCNKGTIREKILNRWDGWIIAGHHHNNSKRYPLVNHREKVFNVSVELIEYTPISIDRLINKR